MDGTCCYHTNHWTRTAAQARPMQLATANANCIFTCGLRHAIVVQPLIAQALGQSQMPCSKSCGALQLGQSSCLGSKCPALQPFQQAQFWYCNLTNIMQALCQCAEMSLAFPGQSEHLWRGLASNSIQHGNNSENCRCACIPGSRLAVYL